MSKTPKFVFHDGVTTWFIVAVSEHTFLNFRITNIKLSLHVSNPSETTTAEQRVIQRILLGEISCHKNRVLLLSLTRCKSQLLEPDWYHDGIKNETNRVILLCISLYVDCSNHSHTDTRTFWLLMTHYEE